MGLLLSLATLAFVTFVYLRLRTNPSLDQFPGPTIARWTTIYKAYYDLVGKGSWIEQLERLHRHYGTVVRVGPQELHFSDPEAYQDIYPAGSKFTKDYRTYRPMVSLNHVFALLDPHAAMARRTMLLPYLSKRSVLEREWIIQQKIDHAIHELVDNQQPSVDVSEVLRSCIGAIVPSFCFPDMQQSLSSSANLLAAVTRLPAGKFPWIVMKYMPAFLLRSFRKIVDTRSIPMEGYSRIDELKAYGSLADDALALPINEMDEGNIFTTLLRRSASSDSRPTDARTWIITEALNLKYAGVDTTSAAAFFAIRSILADTDVHLKLTREIETVWPDIDTPPGLAVLEELPFLTAVIKESLRISVGIISPMNRVVGPGDATIAGRVIPEGTVIGMAHSFLLFKPEIFPDPHGFRPERWLQDDSQALERYLVVFGKGPRNCVGLNIAWCTLYLLLATIFRKVELHPTSEDNLRAQYRLSDSFVAVYEGKPLNVHATTRKG